MHKQHQISTARCLAALVLCSCATATVQAETQLLGLSAPTAVASASAITPTATQAAPMLAMDTRYALGVANYDLDHATEVTGWQVGDRWFLGRQRGMDSGLTLVWQQQANQVSVSKEGVRFTRRF